jgi:uncharacterized protein (DUF58 family)
MVGLIITLATWIFLSSLSITVTPSMPCSGGEIHRTSLSVEVEHGTHNKERGIHTFQHGWKTSIRVVRGMSVAMVTVDAEDSTSLLDSLEKILPSGKNCFD